MKKRINLFAKSRKDVIPQRVKRQIQSIGTMLGGLFFVVFLVATFLQYTVNSEKNFLLSEKQQILEYMIQNKEFVGKMTYFSDKSDQLKKYLIDDAQFLPYYNLLKEALTFQNNPEFSPTLENMKIDKDKNTDFTVRFTSYEPAYAFFRYMESDSFLENFSELTLVGFSLNDSNTGLTRGYQLQFNGKFKPINGNVQESE